MGKQPLTRSKPLSVKELNKQAASLLERSFPDVAVEGEIGRITRHASGHLYFVLKDASACVDAVIWATHLPMILNPVEEGAQVVVRGRVSLWTPMGRYQFVVRALRPAGEGAARAAFLRLKTLLEAEGLTDERRKRPLPYLPRAVGLVTSRSGAAVQDMVRAIHDRFPAMPLVLAPARVQGAGAAADIVGAIAALAGCGHVDVIVVGRGGGSYEDLVAFNDERVARAIAACPLPIVSAVGHEIDVTIADLVADARALTPTAAGELVVPNERGLVSGLSALKDRLLMATSRVGREERRRLDELARRPGMTALPSRIRDSRERVQGLLDRLTWGIRRRATRSRESLGTLTRALDRASPRTWIATRALALDDSHRRLGQAAARLLEDARHSVEAPSRALRSLNPLAVLTRGFSVTTVERDGIRRVLRSPQDVQPGDRLLTAFAAGEEVQSEVKVKLPRSLPEAD